MPMVGMDCVWALRQGAMDRHGQERRASAMVGQGEERPADGWDGLCVGAPARCHGPSNGTCCFMSSQPVNCICIIGLVLQILNSLYFDVYYFLHKQIYFRT
jgi:hypothetical protein